MNRQARIFVAGADTLAGAALLERLRAEGYRNLMCTPEEGLDLLDPEQVERFFADALPQNVFLVAGKSGGIGLNRQCPADLMLDNLLVTTHVLREAQRHGVKRLLYLASSCCYPMHLQGPLRVESLMSGPLEPTSAAYATAKLAGWQLCEAYRRQYGVDFITAIPANPFGPHDDFSSEGGHVIPALIRRAHEAKERAEPTLTVWGTGTPRREFLYARDLADACLFVMDHYNGDGPINLGSCQVYSIAEVAGAIAEVVGYRGRIQFDPRQPDGAPLKALDTEQLRSLGWRCATAFKSALAETYAWFLRRQIKEASTHGYAPV